MIAPVDLWEGTCKVSCRVSGAIAKWEGGKDPETSTFCCNPPCASKQDEVKHLE